MKARVARQLQKLENMLPVNFERLKFHGVIMANALEKGAPAYFLCSLGDRHVLVPVEWVKNPKRDKELLKIPTIFLV